MSGNQFELVRVQAFNAVLLLLLGFALVPSMGTTGAALAMAITVVTTNLWLLKSVNRRLKLFPYNASYVKLIVPTAFMIGTLMLLRRQLETGHSNWAMALIAIIAAYAFFLFVVWVSGVERSDREIIAMLWARIRGGFVAGEVSA
jgi:O-antigen/teichoic acid export membrane protein